MNSPARTRGPLHDDGPLPDFISGLMWLATAVVGVAVLAIPGTPRPHLAVALVLAGFAAGWGVLSLWLRRPPPPPPRSGPRAPPGAGAPSPWGRASPPGRCPSAPGRPSPPR